MDFKGFLFEPGVFAQCIEVFRLESLNAQSAPGMSYFSFKVRKCPVIKVLHLNKENLNGLALWYFSCTIP